MRMIDQLVEVGTKLSKIADEIENNPKVEGFYLTWLSKDPNSSPGITIVRRPIGNVKSPYGNPHGDTGISAYSLEKALRLAAHKTIDPTALSSYQTADTNNERYPGSVLFPIGKNGYNIISVSAYKALLDEAVAIIIGKEVNFGDEAHAKKIISISKNQFYEKVESQIGL